MIQILRIIIAVFGIFFGFTLIDFVNCSNNDDDDNVQLTTQNAIYKGRRLSLPDYPQFRNGSIKSVDQFVGIAYGQAPVGNLRFRKSVPIIRDSLKQKPTIDSRDWKSSCMQQPGFIRMLNLQTKSVSEDCLHLNIWSPNDKNDNSQLKPVLVWFHGGSFISDSAVRTLYTGKHLSALANMVVVTVNYRLDVYGFLYSGENSLNGTESAVGNQAIWDQLLALEWIQDNIRYFNGDPKLVTIAGHNSGATSVGMHLLSAKSRRYFRRAFLSSGSIFSQLVAGNSKQAKTVAENWSENAQKLGCGSGHHWTIETLKCMTNLEDEKLLKMVDPLKKNSVAPEVVVGVDDLFPFGDLLEGIELLKQDFAKTSGLSVLFGSTNDEGSLILPLLDVHKFSMVSAPTLSQKEAYDEMTRLGELIVTPKGVSEPTINGDEVARFYINTQQAQTSGQPKNNARLIGQALGDFYVACPVVEMSTRLAPAANVFQYVWSRNVNHSPDAPCADWMGACHGADLTMLFGQPFEAEGHYFGPDDRLLSAQFIQTIGHFVRFGTPSKQEGKQWPSFSFDPKSGRLIAPYYEFANSANKKNRIYRNDWKRELCRDLWAKHILPGESSLAK